MDKAVEAILKEHPGLFDPKDFIRPVQPVVMEDSEDNLDFLDSAYERILNPESSPLRSLPRSPVLSPRISNSLLAVDKGRNEEEEKENEEGSKDD